MMTFVELWMAAVVRHQGGLYHSSGVSTQQVGNVEDDVFYACSTIANKAL